MSTTLPAARTRHTSEQVETITRQTIFVTNAQSVLLNVLQILRNIVSCIHVYMYDIIYE